MLWSWFVNKMCTGRLETEVSVESSIIYIKGGYGVFIGNSLAQSSSNDIN